MMLLMCSLVSWDGHWRSFNTNFELLLTIDEDFKIYNGNMCFLLGRAITKCLLGDDTLMSTMLMTPNNTTPWIAHNCTPQILLIVFWR